jgi:hypothetical protein
MIQTIKNHTNTSLLQSKLETACLVTDYYKALIQQKSFPKPSFPSLEEALHCNRIRKEYLEKANVSLPLGLKLVNSTLTTDQVVWTWQQLNRLKAASPYTGLKTNT